MITEDYELALSIYHKLNKERPSNTTWETIGIIGIWHYYDGAPHNAYLVGQDVGISVPNRHELVSPQITLFDQILRLNNCKGEASNVWLKTYNSTIEPQRNNVILGGNAIGTLLSDFHFTSESGNRLGDAHN